MANRSKSPKPPTPKQEAASENTSQVRLEELARTSTELARIVAKNSCAAPDLLQELGSSSDDTTRKGVARNPNTSTDVLLKLGAQFPVQLLENPVFPLLLLENPNLLADMPLATLRSLLKRDAVPESFLEWAAGSTDAPVLLVVAMNPNIAVAQNPNTPVSILEQFAQQGKRNNQIKQAALKNLFSQYPDRVVPFLEKYIKLFQPSFTRLLVFLHPLAPSSFLAKNFRSSSWLERYAIAQNPNTPAVIRQRLTQDGNRIVRAAATNLQDSANLM